MSLSNNPNRLRPVSSAEMEARKHFILSHKFSAQEELHRPLNSYQNDKRTLSLAELVRARHEDEISRLQERYRDIIHYPESRLYQSYLKQKQAMWEDYKNQEHWVDFYHQADIDTRHNTNLAKLQAINGTILFGAGALSLITHSPLAPITFSLFYVGSLLNFHEAYRNHQQFKTDSVKKKYIQMVLEDWYEPDPFARYDRAILNNQLHQLDKEKPSQRRHDKKRELVTLYRAKHPKTK